MKPKSSGVHSGGTQSGIHAVGDTVHEAEKIERKMNNEKWKMKNEGLGFIFLRFIIMIMNGDPINSTPDEEIAIYLIF
ncbi:hypothetical protein MASR1M31_10230 [Porphyromonadaceae bacterium]